VITCKMKGIKCEKIRDNFERKFHKEIPKTKSIPDLLTKFQRTESVHDDSKNGRPRKSWERIELFRETFEDDPHLSTRRLSSMFKIPNASIRRILRCGLKYISVPHSSFSQLARRRLSKQSRNVR